MSFRIHKITGAAVFAGLVALAWAAVPPVLAPRAEGQEAEGSRPKVPKQGGDSPAPEGPGQRTKTDADTGGAKRNVTFVLHDAVVEGIGADGDTLSVVLGLKKYPGGNFAAVGPDGTRILGGNLRPKTHLVDLLLKDVSVSRPNAQPGAGRRKPPSLADLKKGTRVGLTILVEDDRLLVTAVTIEE